MHIHIYRARRRAVEARRRRCRGCGGRGQERSSALAQVVKLLVKKGTLNEVLVTRQGGGGVEAAEDADKKGVAWLKRARSGSKAASKATSEATSTAQVVKLVVKQKLEDDTRGQGRE